MPRLIATITVSCEKMLEEAHPLFSVSLSPTQKTTVCYQLTHLSNTKSKQGLPGNCYWPNSQSVVFTVNSMCQHDFSALHMMTVVDREKAGPEVSHTNRNTLSILPTIPSQTVHPSPFITHSPSSVLRCAEGDSTAQRRLSGYPARCAGGRCRALCSEGGRGRHKHAATHAADAPSSLALTQQTSSSHSSCPATPLLNVREPLQALSVCVCVCVFGV